MDELPWDGSFLGIITDTDILEKYILNLEYWRMMVDYQNKKIQIVAIIRKCGNCSPCLVDELKPLFGLRKVGTHYVKYNSKYIILSKPMIKDQHIMSENKLADHKKKQFDQHILNQIKYIYVFRDLLCLGKSNDSSIFLRCIPDDQAISLIDGAIKLERLNNLDKSTYLPGTVFEEWFKDEAPSKILSRMLGYRGGVDTFTFIFKDKLEAIIERISPDYISLSDLLITRIRNKLYLLK